MGWQRVDTLSSGCYFATSTQLSASVVLSNGQSRSYDLFSMIAALPSSLTIKHFVILKPVKTRFYNAGHFKCTGLHGLSLLVSPRLSK